MAVYLGSQKVDVSGLVVKDPDWWDYVTLLNGLFSSTEFPKDYELILEVPKKCTSLQAFCSYCKYVDKITLISKEKIGVSMRDAFINGTGNYTTNTCKTIDLSQFNAKIKDAYNMFCNLHSLKEIIGQLDISESTNVNNIVYRCYSLEEIYFISGCIKVSIALSTCNLLSDASIQSIIDGLADLTESTAQTLTLHTDVKAKLTEEQIATITSKNWTLA